MVILGLLGKSEYLTLAWVLARHNDCKRSRLLHWTLLILPHFPSFILTFCFVSQISFPQSYYDNYTSFFFTIAWFTMHSESALLSITCSTDLHVYWVIFSKLPARFHYFQDILTLRIIKFMLLLVVTQPIPSNIMYLKHDFENVNFKNFPD